jgi:hypothetical protein
MGKKLSDALKEDGAAAPAAAPGSELFASDPWLIAKKSALVDVPASLIGLGGLVERGIRLAPYLPIHGYETSDSRGVEPVLNAGAAAERFAGLAEKYGLLPKNSLMIEPHSFAERAAGIATRVLANPLTYVPGPVKGGVSGVSRNVVGGLAGETAAETAASLGAGSLGQTGAGLSADALTMLLSPSARAGFMVNRVNLGREGAEQVADALSDRLGAMTNAEKIAWSEFEKSATGTTMPGDVLRDVGAYVEDQTKYAPGATRPEVASTVRRSLPKYVDVAELQKVRSAAREEAAQAIGAEVPKKQIARGAGIIRDTAEGMLDVIAQSSPEDALAVAKLREARLATRSRAELFPQESILYRRFFGGKARDNAQEAVAAVLNSPHRKTEVGLILKSLADTPSGLRAFRRAYVQAVMNSPEELASRAGPSALRKLDRYSDTSVMVLGKAGAKQLRKRLADAALSRSAANDASMALARQAGIPWPITRMLGGGAAAASAAIVAGADPAMAARAGGFGAIVLPSMVYISERFGPRAARDVALEALLDPELYEQVTRKVLGKAWPAYTRDLERAVVTRGLHLGLPDDTQEEPR